MKKKEIISRINTCVEKFGDTIEIFDIGTSVCIASIDDANQQAESFNINSFEAFNYVCDIETSSKTMSYKDLEKKKLKEIMIMLEDFISKSDEDNVGSGIHEETHCVNLDCNYIQD